MSQGHPQRSVQPTVHLEPNYVFLFFYESDQSFDYYNSICTSWPPEFSDNAKKLSLEKHQRVQMKVGEGILIRHGVLNDIAIWARVLNEQINRGISFEQMNLSKAHID